MAQLTQQRQGRCSSAPAFIGALRPHPGPAHSPLPPPRRRRGRPRRSASSARRGQAGRGRSGRGEEGRREGGAAPPRTRSQVATCRLDQLELEIGYGLISLVDENQGGDLLERDHACCAARCATELGIIVLAHPHPRQRPAQAARSTRSRSRASRSRGGELMTGCLLAMNPGDTEPAHPGHPHRRAGLRPAGHLDHRGRAGARRAVGLHRGRPRLDRSSPTSPRSSATTPPSVLAARTCSVLLDDVRERYPAVVDELVPDLLASARCTACCSAARRGRLGPRPRARSSRRSATRRRLTKDPACSPSTAARRSPASSRPASSTPSGTLTVITLDPSLEQELADAVVQTPDGSYLGLDPGRAELLCAPCADASSRPPPLGLRPSLVCSPEGAPPPARRSSPTPSRASPSSPTTRSCRARHVETVGVVGARVEGSLA